MTTEMIIEILNDLNGAKRGIFESTKISTDVEYALFSKLPVKTAAPPGSRLYPFYFVKNDDGTNVAAVYVMQEDLHWVVLPEYRNQGILIGPLKKSIIPHLLQESDEIFITIDPLDIGEEAAAASKKIAEKVGFEMVKKERDVSYFRSFSASR